MNQNKYIILIYGSNKRHALRCISADVENIQVECKKLNCSPVINTFRAIYKLFCHLLKCFKFKKE